MKIKTGDIIIINDEKYRVDKDDYIPADPKTGNWGKLELNVTRLNNKKELGKK